MAAGEKMKIDPLSALIYVLAGSTIIFLVYEPGVYLAPWRGDPGRTLVKDSAKVFLIQPAAYRALARALEIRAFSNPKVFAAEPVAVANATTPLSDMCASCGHRASYGYCDVKKALVRRRTLRCPRWYGSKKYQRLIEQG
jgi:hypothetical protein